VAASNILKKFFSNFLGVDLRSPDINQNQNAAAELINAQFRSSGALSKRKGYQLAAEDTKGGFGATTYENVASNGTTSQEYITIDQNLFRLDEDTITLTYSPGDATSGSYEIYYDSDDSTFYFDLYDNSSSRVLHYDMGNGYSGPNNSISTTVSAVNAVSNFTCTGASSGGSQNGAFIPVTAGRVVLSDSVADTITFKYYSQVSTPSTYSNPFSTFYGQRTSTDFENATFAQLQGILYISTGHDVLHKYDGLRVYKAGLPIGTTPTDGAGAGGSLTYSAGEQYLWKYTYMYKDAKGNEIESTPTETVDHTTAGAGESRSITVTNLQETSGYNVDQAVVNGAQATVNTITVDSGHGLVDGDFIYLDDSVSGAVVSREVTATTATTITIDGDAVTVGDNDVISCIKIALYRTKADGTLFFLSKELINDTDNNTQAYDDGAADTSLGAEFLEPIKPHGLPVSGKYIRAWRSQLVISGDSSVTDTVYYSDIESPEYFPPADNSFRVSTTVTGIRELDNLFFVFKKKSIDAVTGDFGTDQFEVDNISSEGIGCEAHASIQEVNKSVWFLAEDGVYSISSEGLEEISEPIKPRFTRPSSTLSFKQAVAFNWNKENKYLLMLPNLPVDPTYASDDNSRIHVFDYFKRHQGWLEWRNFNFLGGISVVDNDLFFTRRAKPDSTVFEHTQKVTRTNTKVDYQDHDAAISFTFRTHWESLEEPGLWKKFLRLRVYSTDPTLGDFEMNSFTLSVDAYGSFLTNSLGSSTIDFAPNAAGWDSFQWGSAPWGEILLPFAKTKLTSKKLASQQLKFTNSTDRENVLISGYELEIVAPYKKFLKE
jgi:hypothetical protein